MAFTTVETVYQDAAAILGDSEQDLFRDAVLAAPFRRAYLGLTSLMVKWGLSLPKRTTYLILRPYTRQAAPMDFGITDFGEPVELQERTAGATVDVLSISNDTPRVVQTMTDHSLASNMLVTLGEVFPASISGSYYITVTDTDKLSLNGSRAGEEYQSGGVLCVSNDRFQDVALFDEVVGEASSTLGVYSWNGEQFGFRGSYNTIELKLRYLTTGSAPTSGDIEIDNAYDYLVTATACYAAPLRGQSNRGTELKIEAFGPSGEADGSGGKLRDLVLPMLQTKNRRPRRPASFRPHKTQTGPIWLG